MSRPKTIIAPEHLELLRKCLAQSFGKPITHSVHCVHLSSHIKHMLRETVSAQTLRRIFGFIQSPFNPSITNLDILSRYCGYQNWHQLLTSNAPSFQPLSATDEAALYLTFYSIELKDEADSNYHNACRNIAARILTDPTLFSQLASPLAQHPTSQVFFYERFPYIDGLGNAYPRGIRLYLHYKKEEQAQLFGQSLLLLAGVLTENKTLAKEYYQALKGQTLSSSYHPFVISRVLGSCLLYKHCVSKESIEPELKEVYKWAKYFSSATKIQFWVFPYYQFMISDYLNLAGLHEHSAAVLNGMANKKQITFLAEPNYLEALTIIQKIATHSHSLKDFIQWNRHYEGWSKLGVLFRHYYRLQVLCVLLAGKRQPARSKLLLDELNDLVQITGFTFFKRNFR